MRESYIKTLLNIAKSIPEIEFERHGRKGISLYLYPRVNGYVFQESGKGEELEWIKEPDSVELAMVLQEYLMTKNFCILILNMALSDSSMPKPWRIAMQAQLDLSKFS